MGRRLPVSGGRGVGKENEHQRLKRKEKGEEIGEGRESVREEN